MISLTCASEKERSMASPIAMRDDLDRGLLIVRPDAVPRTQSLMASVPTDGRGRTPVTERKDLMRWPSKSLRRIARRSHGSGRRTSCLAEPPRQGAPAADRIDRTARIDVGDAGDALDLPGRPNRRCYRLGQALAGQLAQPEKDRRGGTPATAPAVSRVSSDDAAASPRRAAAADDACSRAAVSRNPARRLPGVDALPARCLRHSSMLSSTAVAVRQPASSGRAKM